MTAIGPEPEVGSNPHEFQLPANDLRTASLSDSAGMIRMVSGVPSLDTPVCDIQTRRLSEQLNALGDRVVRYTGSADLPFARARWCGAAGMKRMQALSDHRDMAFGNAYGTHIKELGLESHTVFVIDGSGVIQRAEYVTEITQQPDYDAALAVIQRLEG